MGRGLTPDHAGYARRVARDSLRVLRAIAEALNSSADVEQALERTLALVADLLGLQTGWVWLLDAEANPSHPFFLAAARSLPPYLQQPVRMTGRRCWCIDEFNDGELSPKNIDVLECSRLRPALTLKGAEAATAGLRYHASIPLWFQGKPLGIMNVTGPAWRRLSRAELGLLATIAYQVGIAVERARLAEEGARLARAEERTRIAREIHDTLAQGLTAIALDLEGALNTLDARPLRARERLRRALQTTRGSLEDARESVVALRTTASLGGRPLGAALGALGRALTADTGVRVHLQAADVPGLPVRTEAELLRIAQEALANVRKHARAREVHIRLHARGGRLTLAIRDDGRGFDPTATMGGFGLKGMQERAALLGGRLRVQRAAGGGTRVVATVPLAAQPDLTGRRRDAGQLLEVGR